MDEIIGVEIKQEQDLQTICPKKNWLEILPEIIKTDVDNIVKTEDQYCMDYDADCSNNLLSENRLFLKEENASLGVAEENSVNKTDIDQYDVPTRVILKCKEDYDESASKQWLKEEQGALDEKILVHQTLDLPKISSEAITDLHTEIDLDDIVVKSEDEFCLNCDENSSDNLPSENGLVSKDYPSIEAIQSSETLESDYDSDVKNLINKIDCDQQDVSRQVFYQENVELQTDIIKLKQAEKKKQDNRNKPSNSKEKNHKCHYCDYETVRISNLKQHILIVHERNNATLYCCQHCTFKTLYSHNFRRHLEGHEEKTLYKCPGCKRCYTRKDYFDNHLLKNHDSFQHLITSKILYCNFCTYKTVRSKHLIDHVAQNHDKDDAEKFQCNRCDYFTLQKGNFRRHLLIHSNTRPYLCTVCTKGFNQKISLDSHILGNHRENADLLKSITHKIYHCTFCAFETLNNRNLHKHTKSSHKRST